MQEHKGRQNDIFLLIAKSVCALQSNFIFFPTVNHSGNNHSGNNRGLKIQINNLNFKLFGEIVYLFYCTVSRQNIGTNCTRITVK